MRSRAYCITSTDWRRLALCLVLSLLWGVCQTTPARAQLSSQDLNNPDLTDSERQQAIMLWLDKYLSDSVLMAADDVDKIRQAVAGMTPSQLRQWLAQMKDLIDYVESPQWQETKAWLRGFLRVQAIYSDEEIAKLRTEVRNADANELMQIMKRIQAKHEQLVWMHQASQQTRSAEVAARNQSVARQAAATSSARASRTAGNLPLFGTGVAASSKPSKGYQPPGPLINSRQVAAATVWQEAGLGWGW